MLSLYLHICAEVLPLDCSAVRLQIIHFCWDWLLPFMVYSFDTSTPQLFSFLTNPLANSAPPISISMVPIST